MSGNIFFEYSLSAKQIKEFWTVLPTESITRLEGANREFYKLLYLMFL